MSNFSQVFKSIDNILKNSSNTLIVAIDGNSGAGKSTLASLIKEKYNCNIFHMDDFFLTPELKTPERLNEVGGNVDYVRFSEEVMKNIKCGVDFSYKKYVCKDSTYKVESVKTKQLNVVEGCYSMHPSLIQHYDLRIFMKISNQLQHERILKRSGKFMLDRFVSEWIPLENVYFESLRIDEKCDIVINVV